MFEMNNWHKLYAGFLENGQSRGPQYAPATFRKAFARISVILHGGTIDATSSPGAGTAFTVRLPRHHPVRPAPSILDEQQLQKM